MEQYARQVWTGWCNDKMFSDGHIVNLEKIIEFIETKVMPKEADIVRERMHHTVAPVSVIESRILPILELWRKQDWDRYERAGPLQQGSRYSTRSVSSPRHPIPEPFAADTLASPPSLGSTSSIPSADNDPILLSCRAITPYRPEPIDIGSDDEETALWKRIKQSPEPDPVVESQTNADDVECLRNSLDVSYTVSKILDCSSESDNKVDIDDAGPSPSALFSHLRNDQHRASGQGLVGTLYDPLLLTVLEEHWRVVHALSSKVTNNTITIVPINGPTSPDPTLPVSAPASPSTSTPVSNGSGLYQGNATVSPEHKVVADKCHDKTVIVLDDDVDMVANDMEMEAVEQERRFKTVCHARALLEDLDEDLGDTPELDIVGASSTARISTEAEATGDQGETAFKYEMIRDNRDIHHIWKQWTKGINGNPSICELEERYGTTWRFVKDKNYFNQCRCIVREIARRVVEENSSEEHAIHVLQLRLGFWTTGTLALNLLKQQSSRHKGKVAMALDDCQQPKQLGLQDHIHKDDIHQEPAQQQKPRKSSQDPSQVKADTDRGDASPLEKNVSTLSSSAAKRKRSSAKCPSNAPAPIPESPGTTSPPSVQATTKAAAQPVSSASAEPFASSGSESKVLLMSTSCTPDASPKVLTETTPPLSIPADSSRATTPSNMQEQRTAAASADTIISKLDLPAPQFSPVSHVSVSTSQEESATSDSSPGALTTVVKGAKKLVTTQSTLAAPATQVSPQPRASRPTLKEQQLHQPQAGAHPLSADARRQQHGRTLARSPEQSQRGTYNSPQRQPQNQPREQGQTSTGSLLSGSIIQDVAGNTALALVYANSLLSRYLPSGVTHVQSPFSSDNSEKLAPLQTDPMRIMTISQSCSQGNSATGLMAPTVVQPAISSTSALSVDSFRRVHLTPKPDTAVIVADSSPSHKHPVSPVVNSGLFPGMLNASPNSSSTNQMNSVRSTTAVQSRPTAAKEPVVQTPSTMTASVSVSVSTSTLDSVPVSAAPAFNALTTPTSTSTLHVSSTTASTAMSAHDIEVGKVQNAVLQAKHSTIQEVISERSVTLPLSVAATPAPIHRAGGELLPPQETSPSPRAEQQSSEPKRPKGYQYRLSKSTRTVFDVWTEWVDGFEGGPSISSLNREFDGVSWLPPEEIEVYTDQRAILLEAERIVRVEHIEVRAALERLENARLKAVADVRTFARALRMAKSGQLPAVKNAAAIGPGSVSVSGGGDGGSGNM
ncbi:hypothetical protein BGX28_000343 [Mortierella sp. GBA30]|nr:hypothetical protein BGX28_000343 [Mortierella sp. GBA30]